MPNKNASYQVNPMRAIECARAEIDRDRADHADRVEAGESFKARRRQQHNDGRPTAISNGIQRHAVAIQPLELRRHFAVLRHHVEQADHGDDRGVGRAEEEQQKNDADDPAERLAEPRSKRGGSELLGDEAQHVFCRFVSAATISLRLVRPSVLFRTAGNESMAQPSSAVPNTTSIATGTIAFVAVR